MGRLAGHHVLPQERHRMVRRHQDHTETPRRPHNRLCPIKASNVLLSREYAARHGKDSGIVSNSWNPGNLASELQRHSTAIEKFVVQFLVYKPVFGAYTELFAGWSEEAGKPENDGKYVVPWGRFGDLRADVKGSQDGVKLWEWCERESKPYM